MHHLKEIDGFSLNSVAYAVFDEADRLFEMGFAEQLKEVRGDDDERQFPARRNCIGVENL